MNKKGFTLIELLAVLVVLSILLVIAIPAITGTRSRTLKTLSNEQIKSLKDAGRLLGVQLDDTGSRIANCKPESWISDSKYKCTCETSEGVSVDCSDRYALWKSLEITVEDLKEHGLFEDANSHCKGTLTITKEGTGNYKVDVSDDTTC